MSTSLSRVMKGALPIAALLLCVLASFIGTTQRLLADDIDWPQAFAELCGKTDMAMTLPPEALENLRKQSDALIDKIRLSNDAKAGLYIHRLEKCRDFYRFMLDSIKEKRIVK